MQFLRHVRPRSFIKNPDLDFQSCFSSRRVNTSCHPLCDFKRSLATGDLSVKIFMLAENSWVNMKYVFAYHVSWRHGTWGESESSQATSHSQTIHSTRVRNRDFRSVWINWTWRPISWQQPFKPIKALAETNKEASFVPIPGNKSICISMGILLLKKTVWLNIKVCSTGTGECDFAITYAMNNSMT